MLQENLKTKKEKKVEMLGAHYYLWYERPTLPIIGGGVWRSGYTNTPVSNKYNSRDPEIINQHIKWAKEAGIDFFAINWHDFDSWDDITLKDYYLKHKTTSEIKFCIHYDSSLALNIFKNPVSYDFDDRYSPNKTKGEKFVEDFEYLTDNYFDHPQYLKINNRPVVMIYNVSMFKNISKYFEQLKINMEKRNISLFLIADMVSWAGIKLTRKNISYLWEMSPKELIKTFNRAMNRLFLKKYENGISLSKYFNGITGYNMYSVNRTSDFLQNVDKAYQKFYNYAYSNNLCFVPTVSPGYDDRKLSGLNRPILKRRNGEFYKDFWKITEKYIDPSLKMALITTFNEWHEGTEIESSKEYGTKYLELTKSLKNKD